MDLTESGADGRDARATDAGRREPGGARRARVTIADVAALAGVSIGTASKALNDRGKLRDETRARVAEAARRLGFRPNEMARSLLSGRSFTVGLLTTDHVGRFSLPVLLGAEDALGAGEISVFLCDTRGDAIRERHHLKALASRRVDGLIVAGRRTDPRPPLRQFLDVPVVYAMAPSTSEDDMSVAPDERQGARDAVRHLIAAGRTRIAHITGPARHHSSQARADAFRQALAEAGLEPAGGHVLFGEWNEPWGRQAVQHILHAEPRCDAVFCGSDQIARGAADSLRELGERVPEDIALVGFDNWDVMSTACRPPLTTVDMELSELGRAAAVRLLEAIDDQPQPGTRYLPCRLVIRDSA
ncbi:LacI family transcriptional regulator [Streptomyces sp. PT12]|nr:LacI family transcriptional regulator [Streptomyces sp. PT12]